MLCYLLKELFGNVWHLVVVKGDQRPWSGFDFNRLRLWCRPGSRWGGDDAALSGVHIAYLLVIVIFLGIAEGEVSTAVAHRKHWRTQRHY